MGASVFPVKSIEVLTGVHAVGRPGQPGPDAPGRNRSGPPRPGTNQILNCTLAVTGLIRPGIFGESSLYVIFSSHITRTAGWLPPAECWPLEPQEAEDPLPYGWEQALDIRGKPYYIK
ncbi:unnamed protein product [Plutella xylostella]|uniref:(diamondback moth) hypothetical protein n=1 Tax=Plutella xylostella TaxID=51655 RepID=A0A8S4FZV0_PLUXY|nr:unnamed protein product [Plutella xylostella]